MMDRALKERVIGAVVLVAAVVLLVPVFLDGPANDDAEVRESITLPGQEAQGSKLKTIVLERDRDQPVPAPRNVEERLAQEQAVESKPAGAEPARKTPAESDASATQPTVPAGNGAAASSTGMWAVQLGSFSNQENADRLAASLRKEGYAAFLSQTNAGSTGLHRVRIGPQKDRPAAEAMAAKLGAAGHKGQVVPHP